MSEIFSELQGAEFERRQQEFGGGDQGGQPAALTVSADDFSALEQRIVRAVEMVKRERQARIEAEEHAAHAEAELHDQSPRIEQLERDLQALRNERDHVRQRVERLLAQLDALEL
jgi:septal ring factor EnvC (AmiA/AmiB activator)